jgi:hypothetical protein
MVVSNPDPHGSVLIWFAGSGFRSAFKLRIRINEGKNDPQKIEKSKEISCFEVPKALV